jgi:hypothetical protein
MKKTAKDLLNLPMKEGGLSQLSTMKDLNGANMTLEQAMLVKQMQAAVQGDTDAAAFIKTVIGEDDEDSESTEIADAATNGDTLTMLKAIRNKLAAIADKSTDARVVTSVARQLRDVNAEIEQIERENSRKKGDNPLNVVLLSSARKRAKKAAAE